MNISGINFESIVDGDGVRVTIYVSGCKHACMGCHNPSTHDFNAGKPFTCQLKQEIIEYIKKTPYITGITFSGGDPMYSAKELLKYVKHIKKECPKINFWLYSGFVYDQIIANLEMKELLQEIDVLIDGPFVLSKKDETLLFRGSSNQRIIDVQKSLKSDNVVLYKE